MNKFLYIMFTALLLLTTVGCNYEESWVYRSGDKQVSAGLYTIYQVLALSNVEQVIYEENNGYVPESTEELLQMSAAGLTVTEWVNTNAKEGIAEYFAVLQKFAALGLQLNEDDLTQINEISDSVLQGSDGFHEKNGISREALVDFYTYILKIDCVLLKLYGKGGEYEITETEIAEYIRNTYAMADLLMIPRPYDGLNSPEDEFARKTATKYLNRLQNGEEIENLAYEWMLQSTDSQDFQESLEKPDKRDMRVIVSEQNRGEIGLFIYDAIMETPFGASRIVEDDFAFLIIERIDFTVEPEGFEDKKYDILREISSEDLQSKIVEWGQAVKMTANPLALKRLTPQKIQYNE